MKTARLRLGACAALALVAVVAGGSSALADTQPLVISQVYGGGGNTGATYANDFIEVFNRGPSSVALTGLSLQ